MGTSQHVGGLPAAPPSLGVPAPDSRVAARSTEVRGEVGRVGEGGALRETGVPRGSCCPPASPQLPGPGHSRRQTRPSPARHFWLLLPVDPHRVLPKDTVLGEAP